MTENRRSADPQLSDISLAIGHLQAGQEHAIRSRDVMFRQIEGMNAMLAPLPRLIEDLAESLKAMQPHIANCDDAKRIADEAAKAVAEMKPTFEEMKGLKSRALALIAGIAIAGGVGGHKIAEAARSILGGG